MIWEASGWHEQARHTQVEPAHDVPMAADVRTGGSGARPRFSHRSGWLACLLLPALSFTAAAHQKEHPEEKQWEVVDSSKEPGRIPIDAAYSVLFVMLAKDRPGSEIRRAAFQNESQMSSAGAELVFAAADRLFLKQQEIQKRVTALKKSSPGPPDAAARQKMDELMAEASAAVKEEMERLEETMRRSDHRLLVHYLNARILPGMQVGVEKKPQGK
jgi:hypothetical protein